MSTSTVTDIIDDMFRDRCIVREERSYESGTLASKLSLIYDNNNMWDLWDSHIVITEDNELFRIFSEDKKRMPPFEMAYLGVIYSETSQIVPLQKYYVILTPDDVEDSPATVRNVGNGMNAVLWNIKSGAIDREHKLYVFLWDRFVIQCTLETLRGVRTAIQYSCTNRQSRLVNVYNNSLKKTVAIGDYRLQQKYNV